jgi:hypothetical protein
MFYARRNVTVAALIVALSVTWGCGGSGGPEEYTCEQIGGDRTKTEEVVDKAQVDFGGGERSFYRTAVRAACDGERSARPYRVLETWAGE